MKYCKYSKYCGACKDLDKDYNELLLEKTTFVKSLFKDIYKKEIPVCIGNYYPLKYRNKIHLAFTELKGKTLIGFFEEGSTRVTDIDSCLLFDDWATKLISILREYISRFKIRPYKDGMGIIRYAHARCINNRLQLTLVTVTDNFAGRDWLYKKLTENFKEVSLYLNINRRTDRAIFDNKFKFVRGEKFLNFDMCGVNVSLSPSSFLQVNLNIAEKMYKKALELLEIKENTIVLDLYSGIGITSIMFAKKAKKVISVEEVESSVNNAKFMSKINNAKNIEILLGKCEKIISDLCLRKFDDLVVFVDPARSGLDSRVIAELLKLSPRKIVYMSCNPETCVRDVKLLVCDNKYNLNDITAWDMFPYANGHVELLSCLNRID